MDAVAITANKNTIPFDPQPPMVCSGLRMGTPAMTTRGMKEAQMCLIANLIRRAIESHTDEGALLKIRKDVKDLAVSYPLYPERLKTKEL